MANEAENMNRAMTLLQEAAAVLAQNNTSIGLHKTTATDTTPTVDIGPNNVSQSTQSFSAATALPSTSTLGSVEVTLAALCSTTEALGNFCTLFAP